MQTFPNMRRNSVNLRAVNPTYIFFALAMIYGLIAPIFYYLTPLIGLCVYYLFEHFEDEDYYLENLFIFIYMAFIEINYGFFLFSFLMFFLLFYRGILKIVKESIECKGCLPILYIIFGYVGYFLFNLFLSNIFNLERPDIGWAYLVFILTDIFLAFLLL